MKKQTLVINGLKQRVYTWGNPNKPPLIFYHGWLDTGASFHFMSPLLSRKFYCIAPDMKGYGLSQHGKNPLGYFLFEYIADMHALIQHFSPRKKIRLIGHSLGGALTSIYAGTYPEKISHFVNMEGFGFLKEPLSKAPERAKKWIEDIGTKGFPIHKTQNDFAARLMKGNARLTFERALFLTRHITKKTPQGVQVAADPNHKLIEPYTFSLPQFYVFWENIKAKCLLIDASHTEMAVKFKHLNFKKEMRDRLKHFPKSSIRATIQDSGHMMHHDQPEQVAQVLLDFL